MTTFTYDHIHIRSRDPEKTAAFYEKMFDAQVIRSMQQGKPRIDMKIGGQDVFIAPIEADGKVNAPPVTPYEGLDPNLKRTYDGAASGVGLLADYAYDNLSRRSAIARSDGAGASTAYGYDTASRMIALDHNLDAGATANDQEFDFGYTLASQMQQRATSNVNYDWLGGNVNRAYVRNGLNQYTSVGGVTFSYSGDDGVRGEHSRSDCDRDPFTEPGIDTDGVTG